MTLSRSGHGQSNSDNCQGATYQATCPTCGLPPERGHAATDAALIITALYECPLGHQWATRWAIRCCVCERLVAQDFDPCAVDDGPANRCERCDSAVCDAYDDGYRRGRRAP